MENDTKKLEGYENVKEFIEKLPEEKIIKNLKKPKKKIKKIIMRKHLFEMETKNLRNVNSIGDFLNEYENAWSSLNIHDININDINRTKDKIKMLLLERFAKENTCQCSTSYENFNDNFSISPENLSEFGERKFKNCFKRNTIHNKSVIDHFIVNHKEKLQETVRKFSNLSPCNENCSIDHKTEFDKIICGIRTASLITNFLENYASFEYCCQDKKFQSDYEIDDHNTTHDNKSVTKILNEITTQMNEKQEILDHQLILENNDAKDKENEEKEEVTELPKTEDDEVTAKSIISISKAPCESLNCKLLLNNYKDEVNRLKNNISNYNLKLKEIENESKTKFLQFELTKLKQEKQLFSLLTSVLGNETEIIKSAEKADNFRAQTLLLEKKLNLLKYEIASYKEIIEINEDEMNELKIQICCYELVLMASKESLFKKEKLLQNDDTLNHKLNEEAVTNDACHLKILENVVSILGVFLINNDKELDDLSTKIKEIVSINYDLNHKIENLLSTNDDLNKQIEKFNYKTGDDDEKVLPAHELIMEKEKEISLWKTKVSFYEENIQSMIDELGTAKNESIASLDEMCNSNKYFSPLCNTSPQNKSYHECQNNFFDLNCDLDDITNKRKLVTLENIKEIMTQELIENYEEEKEVNSLIDKLKSLLDPDFLWSAVTVSTKLKEICNYLSTSNWGEFRVAELRNMIAWNKAIVEILYPLLHEVLKLKDTELSEHEDINHFTNIIKLIKQDENFIHLIFSKTTNYNLKINHTQLGREVCSFIDNLKDLYIMDEFVRSNKSIKFEETSDYKKFLNWLQIFLKAAHYSYNFLIENVKVSEESTLSEGIQALIEQNKKYSNDNDYISCELNYYKYGLICLFTQMKEHLDGYYSDCMSSEKSSCKKEQQIEKGPVTEINYEERVLNYTKFFNLFLNLFATKLLSFCEESEKNTNKNQEVFKNLFQEKEFMKNLSDKQFAHDSELEKKICENENIVEITDEPSSSKLLNDDKDFYDTQLRKILKDSVENSSTLPIHILWTFVKEQLECSKIILDNKYEIGCEKKFSFSQFELPDVIDLKKQIREMIQINMKNMKNIPPSLNLTFENENCSISGCEGKLEEQEKYMNTMPKIAKENNELINGNKLTEDDTEILKTVCKKLINSNNEFKNQQRIPEPTMDRKETKECRSESEKADDAQKNTLTLKKLCKKLTNREKLRNYYKDILQAKLDNFNIYDAVLENNFLNYQIQIKRTDNLMDKYEEESRKSSLKQKIKTTEKLINFNDGYLKKLNSKILESIAEIEHEGYIFYDQFNNRVKGLRKDLNNNLNSDTLNKNTKLDQKIDDYTEEFKNQLSLFIDILRKELNIFNENVNYAGNQHEQLVGACDEKFKNYLKLVDISRTFLNLICELNEELMDINIQTEQKNNKFDLEISVLQNKLDITNERNKDLEYQNFIISDALFCIASKLNEYLPNCSEQHQYQRGSLTEEGLLKSKNNEELETQICHLKFKICSSMDNLKRFLSHTCQSTCDSCFSSIPIYRRSKDMYQKCLLTELNESQLYIEFLCGEKQFLLTEYIKNLEFEQKLNLSIRNEKDVIEKESLLMCKIINDLVNHEKKIISVNIDKENDEACLKNHKENLKKIINLKMGHNYIENTECEFFTNDILKKISNVIDEIGSKIQTIKKLETRFDIDFSFLKEIAVFTQNKYLGIPSIPHITTLDTFLKETTTIFPRQIRTNTDTMVAGKSVEDIQAARVHIYNVEKLYEKSMKTNIR